MPPNNPPDHRHFPTLIIVSHTCDVKNDIADLWRSEKVHRCEPGDCKQSLNVI